MKIFFSEFPADYKKYHFPYQVWLLKEEGDEAKKIYENGFLPMRNHPNVYYLSRNIRVNLTRFEPSSENRRILKKTEGFEFLSLPLSKFTYTSEVQKFCKDYAEQKLGRGLLSTAAIKAIFSNGIFNYVFVFKEIPSGRQVGYTVCYVNSSFLQYAHAFYDLNFLKENLGARMMLEAVLWAKKNNKEYVYLGTCYDQSALYKTEFKGVEFFNGFRWSDNLDELKELIENNVNFGGYGRDYLLRNKEFIERFYQCELTTILNKYGVRVNF